MESVKSEDDTELNGHADDEGRVWRVQAHARSAITAMKVDPVDGSGVSGRPGIELTLQVYTSSYDCSLRHLDFRSGTSREMFSFPDENMLITHFDLTPDGHSAWIADKDGGVSHCDLRGGDRRRWVVMEEGRASKLGGISVNRASRPVDMPKDSPETPPTGHCRQRSASSNMGHAASVRAPAPSCRSPSSPRTRS